MQKVSSILVALLACALLPTAALAQNVYVYPQKGQSPEQQAKDQGECAQWATGQTGFNPSAAAPPPAQAAPTGGAVRGAARGAVAGAAVGAIAGDAGKGAAIGATAGGMGGAMRKRDNQQVADQQNQQAAAQQDAKRAEYQRALGACLSGRGYSVQ